MHPLLIIILSSWPLLGFIAAIFALKRNKQKYIMVGDIIAIFVLTALGWIAFVHAVEAGTISFPKNLCYKILNYKIFSWEDKEKTP